MIVAVDATPALRSNPSGTEVYAKEVIEALVALRGDRTVRCYANVSSAPAWLDGRVEWRPLPFPRLWTHWAFARALARDRPDVVYVPSHVLPAVLRAPGVVTIHDVGHRYERSAYRAADWWYLELSTRWMARRARRLIAVSQSTADDLNHFYRVPYSRIAVVHSGISQAMRPQPASEVERVRATYRLPARYYLYLGRAHPRKNLPFLLDAFAQARRTGLEASLVLAGSGHGSVRQADVHVLPYVPAADLPPLYAGARALLLPSRFEGFGFPVLEAMGCGTAVIASTAGALPEIVGQAGLLRAPQDRPGWIEAMLRLDQDEEQRQRMIEKGRAWSARFTWEAAAHEIWRVLDQAAATR
jgi:glycosyltransferase involved in cell wall biosynthesis